MARYPELSNLINIPTKELRDMYNEIQRWGATLLNELDSRDALVDNRPSTTIRVEVTSGNVLNPQKGDVVYSTSAVNTKALLALQLQQHLRHFFNERLF